MNPGRIREIAVAFMSSRVLQTAIELDVFTVLADGPLSSEALTERLRLHARAARDFFDSLVALGLLQRDAGNYANTPETDTFLDRRKPTSIGAAIELNSLMYSQWTHLERALRTGEPQPAWTDRWAERYGDEEYLRKMRQAMTIGSGRWAGKLATAFPWSDYKSFADLGCAEGALPVAIVREHPKLEGIGFDLPALEPHFDRYVGEQGLGGRLRFQGGDFFSPDPFPAADVLIMSGVLHSWSREEGRRLLEKAFSTLEKGGALIVRDGFVDEARKDLFPLLLSLQMLVDSVDGRGFERRECETWLREVGFVDVTTHELDPMNAIVVGRKG